MELLRDTGKFLTLDTKILSALLGKLKPTARLSPECKGALIVSDSSTALCKSNRT